MMIRGGLVVAALAWSAAGFSSPALVSKHAARRVFGETRRWSESRETPGAATAEAAAPAEAVAPAEEETAVAAADEEGTTVPEPTPAATAEDKPFEIELSGLRWRDELVGDGESPETGDVVVIDYRGSLTKTGKQFDASYDRGVPFSFELGKRSVIPGMDQGVKSMRVGGKRTLLIPPRLGYGPVDLGKIPPNSELKFEIELKEIKSGAAAKAGMMFDNVKGAFGLNLFTFFTALFVLLFFVPLFTPK
mmetsp:Transcript_24026/g.74033  ORF Transcript_24026/g.74033 Transcript_24026/m.74033 type:complete len:248 (+) Transcript_24026:25-768(+)